MAEIHKEPQEYTLRIRRFDPESGDAAYWDEHTIELEPHRSVLEGILQARARFDGSIGIRCSCRAAICGSCGVRINGQPGLACHTHLDKAEASSRDGVIEVEPMGNMPVLKDLIVDMDAVHWKKIQRVTPWLINKEPIPEREYIVPAKNMVDVTQSMACIQCGACVSDCLSMEVDPLFIGPAALAKAYRFAGDPRDAEHYERLKDLSEDPHGIYDCTHCFKCIDACPKGVAPMNQIMRLRRLAGDDFGIVDRNNGHRHEQAFVSLVRDHGLLWEAELLPRSYGGDSWFGKFAPSAGAELASSLPAITKALIRGKVTPMGALKPHKIPKQDLAQIQSIYKEIEGHEERYELNLYISGYDEESPPGEGMPSAEQGQPGIEPEESPTR
ncbi:MAG: succinate dehydrogenase / fumarate reductase, iron-sulfur subunit [Solirubrobacteraceae bacterium]|jgi:succinate dehydrogenase / fumarate reductase iron-sulfur subunit|nr:succinate dehydrogenase / fumarate reductase, iron-sulfur subunit [Solirubrobacteraceae bacterium]